MNILILGGTGLIGSAITGAMLAAGAHVSVLCRSEHSCERAESLKAAPLRGEIGAPSEWIKAVELHDTVIHCACTFGSDMPGLDKQLLDALFENMRKSGNRKTLIYTGGTWLYPHSRGKPINEHTPYSPVAGFEWMVDGVGRIQSNTDIRGLVIHPAIVVNDPDGIPDLLKQDFADTGELHIPFNEQLRWPIVHCIELAQAYYCLLENGVGGTVYNAATVEAASVADLVRSLGNRHHVAAEASVAPISYWASRYGDIGGYPRSQQLRSAKLRTLGWSPSLLNTNNEEFNRH